MGTWNISVLESGSVFTADGTIPIPHADLETKRISNLQIIKLADGTEGFIQPETKYYKDTINMFFANTTSAFRTKIEDYITNGDKIKIVTSTGGTFIGYFTDMMRVWFSGIDDTFDCMLSFKETLT